MHVRNRDCQIGLFVEGELKGGSFKRLENFQLDGGDEIEEVETIGEPTPLLEKKKGNVSVKLSFREIDNAHFDLNELLDLADAEGNLPPNVSIMVITPHRGPGTSTRTYSLREMLLKFDSTGGAGGELKKWDYSGMARKVEWR